MEDLGRFDSVVVLCWLLGFMDLIAGDMGLGFGFLLWRLIMGRTQRTRSCLEKIIKGIKKKKKKRRKTFI